MAQSLTLETVVRTVHVPKLTLETLKDKKTNLLRKQIIVKMLYRPKFPQGMDADDMV